MASWKEDTHEELGGGRKLTHAEVALAFSGGIEGDGTVRWLMAYRADGTASFVGLARIKGTLDGRSGSFVLENTGTFDGMVARGRWSVVDGSGTDALERICGTGGFEAAQEATYSLAYQL